MPKKTCKELFLGVECTILGNPDEAICGLAYSSDRVSAGDAFFCIVGLVTDGHQYAQDALDKGAKVIVCQHPLDLDSDTEYTEVVVKDSRRVMAQVSSAFYDHPSQHLEVVGITGTNGKTTVTYLVENMIKYAGKQTGLIGTVGIHIGEQELESHHTTPESPDLQHLFSRMKEAQCETVCMEVSSHAIDLDRIYATSFALTAFTNLTQDHLDYHDTLEAYFEAKARLFSQEYPAQRVICIDDEAGKELFRRCTAAHENIITTGFDESAVIHPIKVGYGPSTTTVTLDVEGVFYSFSYPLVGKFNVANVMTAFAIGIMLGIDHDVVIEALSHNPQVPGRLERVGAQVRADRFVYVDYAHTPDALEKAIASLKPLAEARTIVVFGCGGDRDKGKRPLMGKAALGADYCIVTSDNPRTEDPLSIIEDIVPGMTVGEGRYEVVADRKDAIRRALEIAEPYDSVLIAGKGHEDYQIIGANTIDFDDRKIALELLTMLDKEICE